MPVTRRTFVQQGLSAAALAAAGVPLAGRAAPGEQGARPAATKRILILGGTGFLGPALVEVARSRGHALTLFNRGKTRPHLFPDVEKLHGDRDGKLDALKGRRWDAVIDNSGYVPRVVKASAELLAPNVSRYVFVSSISVYREDLPPGSDESAPLATMADPASEDVRASYGALKALCEKAAEQALPGRTTVVRPTLIVGPDDPTDRFTYWPVRLARGGEVLAPGDGEDPVQLIDVRDLAAWMIALVERDVGGVFNAAGPRERLTMRAMLDACQLGTGAKAKLTWVPADFLEARQVAPWVDLPSWIPRGPDAGMSQVSNARAVAAGLAFRPLADTARDTLAWWRGLPQDRRAKLRAGLSAEREKEVLAEWARRDRKKG
jgi:nucleoside-diphosphate-sugar epimerase